MNTLNTSRETDRSASSRDILANGGPSKSIPTRWLWHCKTLLKLRDRLLTDQRGQSHEIATALEPHSMDPADSATDEFDHNLILGELSLRQNALFEIDEALHQILNGTYGVCEETGKSIEDARLRAIPWTRFCKAAEERLEKSGLISHPALGLLQSLRRSLDSRKQSSTQVAAEKL